MYNKVFVRVVFDRKNEATRKKTALIQIEVRHEGKRKFISTGIKVLKNQFKSGRVVNCEDADIFNEKIDQLFRHVNKIVLEANEQDLLFDFDMLESHTNYDGASVTFIEFFERRLAERANQASTKRQHRKVLKFLKTEYTKIIRFSDLTKNKIIELDEYLHNRILPNGEHMCQTTIYTYHKVIRIYVNEAIQKGIIESSPYDHYKTPKGRSKVRVSLTIEELHQFMNYIPPTAFQQKIKDLFIIQCYTGLAYADLIRTDFTQMEKIGDDYVLTKETRLKTGTRFILFILPPVMEVLKRYDFKVPQLAYDVYNRNLKAVAIAAGLKKTVTTHIGRHTFATTVALGSGIPIEVVSKMLGHTNINTTQIYAKILPQQVISGFRQIKNHI